MDLLRRLGVLLLEWSSLAVGVTVASAFGFLSYDGRVATLAVVAVVLGIFNSFLRPIIQEVLMVVSLPLLILSLGLAAYLVLFLANGAILYLTDMLISDFNVKRWAWATLTISLSSWFISSALGIDQF
ncbi:MAG: phage holin family protein, partial [Verrucomicrobiota bacterium]